MRSATTVLHSPGGPRRPGGRGASSGAPLQQAGDGFGTSSFGDRTPFGDFEPNREGTQKIYQMFRAGFANWRAALYLRGSPGRQAEHDLSIPDQRRQLHA